MSAALNEINAMGLNSQAVNSLLKGERRKSIVDLQHALHSSRIALRVSESIPSQQQTRLACTIRPVALLPGPSQTVADAAFPVFAGAFAFTSIEDESKDEGMHRHLISAVLLYNMGLCHQQEAMCRAGCCAVGLETAKAFYRHALDVMELLSEDIRQDDLLLSLIHI